METSQDSNMALTTHPFIVKPVENTNYTRIFNCFFLCRKVASERGKKEMRGLGTHSNGGVKNKTHIKMPFHFRKNKNHKNEPVVEPVLPSAPLLSFEENLAQSRFAEAGLQLVAREEQLCGQGDEASRERLGQDYDRLCLQMWGVVMASLSLGDGELERLKSAVEAIAHQEERDRRWKEESQREAPCWRPLRCRSTHDRQLWKIVESRMDSTEEVSGADILSSSVKKEVFRLGKRLKDDLLTVVRSVKGCYPQEFDICNTYARLYHAAFSIRMRKLTEFVLDHEDCSYLLCWIHNYYPNNVLKSKELQADINTENLEALLPKETLTQLEEQYFAYKQCQISKWILKALQTEEEKWVKGVTPELTDGHYFSELPIDIIQLINGSAKEAREISDEIFAALKSRLLTELESFFMSYKKYLEDVMKGKQDNSTFVKANLLSIKQFRDYVANNSEFFKDGSEERCILTLKHLEDSGYRYLIGIMQNSIKSLHRDVGTTAWLSCSKQVMDSLLHKVEELLQGHKDMSPDTFQELVGRLHLAMIVEYCRRLMKHKLKLRDEAQQRTAADRICTDSKKLQCLFKEYGSKDEWLNEVLGRIAEVIKLQDLSTIQLEIATLARDYPDISERHVADLLYLKANLSSRDVKTIKSSLTETKHAICSSESKPFFSKVVLKKLL